MSIIDSLNKLLGDPNEKELKRIRPIVAKVRSIQESEEMQSLKLEDVPEVTEKYKKRIAKGEKLDDLLPEAFALVCRTCELLQGNSMKIGEQEFIWNMIPYDVQIIGGVVMHRGSIAEMKTGEGKTIVAPLAAYLNSLTGKGVHIITVNDYLATRDSEWMGKLFSFLGLSVGVILHNMNDQERKDAYNAD
ncbi:MAG: hypothetical protein KAS32_22885, partial [Candidatus Peribacteraceae bacterium]|nr:hypothetical protein [Candidatus Peribacteraceae bacterium]